jgi:hypothetical protein
MKSATFHRAGLQVVALARGYDVYEDDDGRARVSFPDTPITLPVLRHRLTVLVAGLVAQDLVARRGGRRRACRQAGCVDEFLDDVMLWLIVCRRNGVPCDARRELLRAARAAERVLLTHWFDVERLARALARPGGLTAPQARVFLVAA